MQIVYQSNNSNIPAIASSASALAANPARLGWRIENLGANPLFISLGGTASTTVFHYLLAAASLQDNGTGGKAEQMNGVVFTGAITIAGTSPRYTVTEIAP